MTVLPSDWSTQQLAEFLAVVSSSADPADAMQRGVERAAEAFEAEVGFLVLDDEVVAVVGFAAGTAPVDTLLHLDAEHTTELPGVGKAGAMLAHVAEREGRLGVVRHADDPFGIEERNLLRGMARVLDMTLGMLERQMLLERLSLIQRSISHRAPLQEVLDAITSGGRELLGVDSAGLRIIDPDDPSQLVMVSSSGVSDEMLARVRRSSAGEGVGGKTIAEDRVIVVADYARDPASMQAFAEDQLQAAMGAPVHEDGVAVGSLVVGSYRPGRRFSVSEQQALRALAEHASLALTDAKTVEEMREAQRSRDMFLAMVSHELKTPLTVMMGALKTLQIRGTELAPELVRELIASGFDRGRELEALIDKLLRGARAELAGAATAERLPSLLREAIGGFAGTNRVVLEPPPDIGVVVDRGALLQVVGALIENAISHSPAGGEIRIRAASEEGRATIEIENQGSLPRDADMGDLFAAFRRGSDARSPGVGLGLYIAKKVAESMDGSLEARSGEGRVIFSLGFPTGSDDLRRASAS